MPELAVTPFEIFLAGSILFFGAIVQGSAGFGLALTSVPFLVLIDPYFVPAPLSFAALFLNVSMTVREGKHMEFKAAVPVLTGLLPGSIAGAWILGYIPQDYLGVFFGGLILLAVLITATGYVIKLTTGNRFSAGAVSGFMGTSANIGGPPLALIYQHAHGPVLRGTLAVTFLVSSVMTIGSLYGFGHFGFKEMLTGLMMMPGIALGFIVSNVTSKWLDRGYTRIAVYVISTISAIHLIVQTVF